MQKGNYVYIHTHLHTLAYLYICLYIYKCECINIHIYMKVFLFNFLKRQARLLIVDIPVNFALSNYLSQAEMLKVLG